MFRKLKPNVLCEQLKMTINNNTQNKMTENVCKFKFRSDCHSDYSECLVMIFYRVFIFYFNIIIMLCYKKNIDIDFKIKTFNSILCFPEICTI